MYSKLHSYLSYDERKRRVIEMAYFYIDHKCTIRDIAKEFRVSKSTVHRWFHIILPYLIKENCMGNKSLWEEVQHQLSYNKNTATERMAHARRCYK